MNPKLKKGLNIALTVLIVLLLIIGVFMVIYALTSRDDQATSLGNVFGYKPLYLETDSMSPGMPKGTLVLIRKLDTYEVGDVVTYYLGKDDDGKSRFNTHKIIAKGDAVSGGDYQTQGTKEGATADAPILAGLIQGKVVISIPVLGYVFMFLQSFWGFGIVIMLPLLAFFLYRVFVLLKVVNAIQKEKNPTVKMSDYDRLLKEVEALKQQQSQAAAAAPDQEAPPPNPASPSKDG